MEAVTNTHHVYRSLQFYWRRRSYGRIEDQPKSNGRRTAALGGNGSKLRIKLGAAVKTVLRIKVKIATPKRLLVKLRHSYITAMHTWAGTVPSTKEKTATEDKAKVAKTRRRIDNKEEGEISNFEKMMMLHMYNNVMGNPRELKRPTT